MPLASEKVQVEIRDSIGSKVISVQTRIPPVSNPSIDPNAPELISGYFVRGETPTGAINGINREFAVSHVFTTSVIWVYYNGIALRPSEYSISQPNKIILLDAPVAGDSIIVDYAL